MYTATGNYAQLRQPAQKLCLECHGPAIAERAGAKRLLTEHTHHKEGSAGSECIACHMPKIENDSWKPRWFRAPHVLPSSIRRRRRSTQFRTPAHNATRTRQRNGPRMLCVPGRCVRPGAWSKTRRRSHRSSSKSKTRTLKSEGCGTRLVR